MEARFAQYQRWLEQQPQDASYLFSDERVRFTPRADDLLVLPPQTALERRDDKLWLVVPPGERCALEGVDAGAAQSILNGVGQGALLADLERLPHVVSSDVRRFVACCFGRVLFAPLALSELERRLSGIEITRLVSSPYEIDRGYWENMISVRTRLDELPRACHSPERMMSFLRELHVVALTGADGHSFYKPASPITRGGVTPGAFLETPTKIERRKRGVRFVSGPRVNVTLLGGSVYHQLLARQLKDPAALDAERSFVEAGLGWGRIETGRAAHEDADRPWYCPPRPMRSAHFARLAAELRAAWEACERTSAEAPRAVEDAQDCIAPLARFHRGFLHLHPFRCANQCLAMNIVNHMLQRALGAGIPHLLLDHLALRLAEPAYERLFTRAVEAFLDRAPSPARRYATLGQRKRSLYAFVQRLATVNSLAAAEALLQRDPAGARLALLVSPQPNACPE